MVEIFDRIIECFRVRERDEKWTGTASFHTSFLKIGNVLRIVNYLITFEILIFQ